MNKLALLGPGLILAFVVSQAARDVYLAHVFRSIDVFATVLATFSLMALVFGALALWRDRAGVARLRAHLPLVVWMNVTTALAWTSYFFSLTLIQPSVLNALHSGLGPLTVLALGFAGFSIGGQDARNRLENICYAGLAFSMVVLWGVTLGGYAGRTDTTFSGALGGLLALSVSGVAITLSHLIARRLNDLGIGPSAVTGARYLLIALVAAIVVAGGRPTGLEGAGDWLWLAAVATPLIALPLYALQVGISMTRPLTAHALRALGPVVIFALELVDDRVVWSAPALAGILLYSAFAVAASLARGAGAGKSEKPAPKGA